MTHNDTNPCAAKYDEAWARERLKENPELIRNFHIYLQPQVDREGNILGAEVLSRWITEDNAFVPPDVFIPVLTEMGLIPAHDARVWYHAAEQLASWKGTKRENLYLTVNVEPAELMSMDVTKLLGDICDDLGIDRSKLHIEITERGLVPELYGTGKDNVINLLHSSGFVVELDDFGKSNDSFTLLRDLDIDMIKLDASFLPADRNTQKWEKILESVVRMAKALSLEVIAEGVEDESQRSILHSLGCNIHQGYFYARPMPVDEFEKLGKIIPKT